MMTEIKGNENLQLAKDLLCAFETVHYPKDCSDIRESLYWDEERQCYSADVGFLLRGETEEVRIYKADEDWLEASSRLVAFVEYKGSLYFFGSRF